uniref:Putative ovule protein n=1 Tax=Solanum chacoense TaxID=4108 RepID=A0A0V0GSS0_SOLCH
MHRDRPIIDQVDLHFCSKDTIFDGILFVSFLEFLNQRGIEGFCFLRRHRDMKIRLVSLQNPI